MANVYTYSISSDFGGVVPNISNLHADIVANGVITETIDGITQVGDNVLIYFQSALSGGEQTELSNVVSALDNTPIHSDVIDANGKRIISLGDAIEPDDAVQFQVFSQVFKPIITDTEKRMAVSETANITLNGYNFTPNTAVTIVSQTVNSVAFVSPNEIVVNVTTSATPGMYETTVTSEAGSTIIADFLVTSIITWIDLRSGGETLTTGTTTGVDVRTQSAITVSRDANGMFFDGTNPWSSWVKFERGDFVWARGDNNTIEWIMTRPTAAMMIGIGSDQTNETSTAQYAQAETLAYFSSSTLFWGLFGNNGNPGSSANQSNNVNISGGTGVYKVRFTLDGSNGGEFTLYELPSANQGDWNDISTVLVNLTISISPNQTNIMPFIIPRSGSTQRFIAFKID